MFKIFVSVFVIYKNVKAETHVKKEFKTLPRTFLLNKYIFYASAFPGYGGGASS